MIGRIAYHVMRATPGWITLRSLGESRLIRTSYFWFAVIPILAKWANSVSNLELQIPFTDGKTFSPELPFKWQLFYYGSVAFALASFVYSLYCPEIVRKYESYTEFTALGNQPSRTIEFLRQHILPLAFEKWFVGEKVSAAKRETEFFHRRVCEGQIELPEGSAPKNLREWRVQWNTVFNRMQVRKSDEAEAFWLVRDLSSGSWPFSRFVCTVAYGIGFLLFGVVMVNSFASVLTHSWKSIG